MIVETCCDSITAMYAAVIAGTDRIELCYDLSCGGVSPHHADIDEAGTLKGLPVNVLIRPRGGDFVYDEKEIENLRLALSAGNGLIYMSLGAEGKPSERPVRAVDGPYAGVHGYYKRVDGNRMVLLPVSGVATVRLPFIPPAALANA